MPGDEEPFLKVVRARIRAARLARDLSQERAADLCGLQHRTYRTLEARRATQAFNPGLSILRAVSSGLGVSLCDLLRDPTPEELADVQRAPSTRRASRARPN